MANKKKHTRKRYATRRTPQNQKRRNQTIRTVLVSLGILAIIAATLFFLVFRSGTQISIAENAIGSLLTPIQNAFTTVTTGAKNFVTRWRDYDLLQDEYDALSRENQQLSLELTNSEEMQIENERLKELLTAQDTYESLDPIYAKVIARDAGQWFYTFSINRGTAHGVSSGMAVVNGDGLIGHVYEAGLNYAKVLTIIDSRSGLSCLIQRTRDNGVMRGGVADDDDSAQCYVYYLPNVNNIVPGDIVITSGTDKLYPKGLKVGTVTQLSLDAGYEGNYAVVVPSVDFQHIEEVMVLRTVVETDEENGSSHAAMPTPSPTPSATPNPNASATATPNPQTTEEDWTYPQASTTAEAPDVHIESLPEDEWANG